MKPSILAVPHTVLARPSRPLLIYDGGCAFCRLWISRWQVHTAQSVEYASSQEVAGRFAEIGAEVFDRTVVLILPDGSVHTGAAAVLRARAMGRGGAWRLALYEGSTRFRLAAETCYRFIADHRTAASRWTHFLWGKDPTPSTYLISRNLYLRLLGLIFFFAFVSLWVQIDGLIGSQGILPVGPYLEAARNQLGVARFWQIPTLAWLGSGDTAVHLLCAGGVLGSVLLILGLVPLPALIASWALYLSLATVSRTFLNFQWDYLLLEAGFASMFLAPLTWSLKAARGSPPTRLARALVGWLVFRLMFASGVVKLSSGDPTWWQLTALDLHFETQPLPTWTAWFVHHLPAWFHRFSLLVVFAIELAVPFFIVTPRRLRHASVLVLLFLQGCIAATGNYGFFNLLAMVILVPLVDDTAWPTFWRRPTEAIPTRQWPNWIVAPVAMLLFALGTVNLVGAFRTPVNWPAPVQTLRRAVAPFRSANGYGLFSVMTKTRPEIIVEGSDDGIHWKAYEFRWKPGDPHRRPPFVGPHMPRLDWQMWFAALGNERSNPWFARLEQRLLQGSPAVLALLSGNPFPEAPPRYVRAVLYDYHFTDSATRRRDGTWWRRQELHPYSRVRQLRRPGPG